MALYNTIGQSYSTFRRADPRIALAISRALGDAASVVNVGAGSGSYEPRDRKVIAIEPSEVMIRQRAPDAAPCLQGSADAIPLETGAADAAMAVLSAHHWPDLEQGLREMARVARRRVVLLTWVPDSPPFWLTRDYFPEILAHDRIIFPETAVLLAMLERSMGPARAEALAIPHDCIDGMLASYWRRPELYLEPDRRRAISSFARIDPEPGLAALRSDLAAGRWHERNHNLMALDELDAGYRIIVCERRPATKPTSVVGHDRSARQ